MSMLVEGERESSRIMRIFSETMREYMDVDRLYTTLREELHFLNYYVEILHFRMGRRLQYLEDVPEDLLEMEVPRLILQPLVENSIIHGIEQKIGIGDISLTGFSNDDTMHLVVKDNGIGMSEEQIAAIFHDEQGKSIGMHNVHRRIQLHFGNAYGLRINSRIGVGTTVELVLPSNCQGPN